MLLVPIAGLAFVFFPEVAWWITLGAAGVPLVALYFRGANGEFRLERRGADFVLVRDPYRVDQQEEIVVGRMVRAWHYGFGSVATHATPTGRTGSGRVKLVRSGADGRAVLALVFYGVGDRIGDPVLVLRQVLEPWESVPPGWPYVLTESLEGVAGYNMDESLLEFGQAVEVGLGDRQRQIGT